MNARIILVRHGRSGHPRKGMVDARGFGEWCVAYDAAGLADGEAPPPELLKTASVAIVVASDMPRARETASMLAPGSEIRTSPLLRETDLPIPSWKLRYPVMIWLMGSGLGWARERLPSAEPPAAARARADEAVRWLVDLGGDTIIVVTHGSFRRLLAESLLARGWREDGRGDGWPGPGWRRHANWSAWTFRATSE